MMCSERVARVLEELDAQREQSQRQAEVERRQQPAGGVQRAFDEAFDHGRSSSNKKSGDSSGSRVRSIETAGRAQAASEARRAPALDVGSAARVSAHPPRAVRWAAHIAGTVPMTALTHEFTETLPAAPERVFAALTDESSSQRWFAEHAEIELRAGVSSASGASTPAARRRAGRRSRNCCGSSRRG